MAIKTINEIIEAVRNRIGDDSSDSAIELMEDVTDTLNDYNTRLIENGDWKIKYEENDKKWREKYKERFTSGEAIKKEQKEQVLEDNEVRSFEDLFEEREG